LRHRSFTTPPRNEKNPPLRIAVLHHGDKGRDAISDGDVAEQLRMTYSHGIPIEVPLSDPFIDHREEWADHTRIGAYDVALLEGPLTPPVIAFAVLAGTPIAQVQPEQAFSFRAVIAALSRRHVDSVPVGQITLDGLCRYFTGAVTIVAENGGHLVRHIGTLKVSEPLISCEIRPGTELALEIQSDGTAPLRCDRIDVDGEPGDLLVELDGRPRRQGRVRMEPAPRPLELVRLDKYA
jgi:hypothetical protein